MTEQWLPVVGYEGVYEVSDRGRVRSLHRNVVRSDGVILMLSKKVLTPTDNGKGRLRVSLTDSRGVRSDKQVHRLVADAFILNPEGYPYVLHWDDDPSNNQTSNLRWGTDSHNKFDQVRNGYKPNSNKTKCKRGHTFSVENTLTLKGGRRACRVCKLATSRAQRQGGSIDDHVDDCERFYLSKRKD